MKQIALIGSQGFVGSALLKALQKDQTNNVQPVARKDYHKLKKKNYDIVINAAMPSARFWAQNNPYEDFRETVEKTAEIVYEWKYKKMVQISTISARTEKESIYGRHKAMAELLCNDGKNVIFRLTAMYDETLEKGVLIDIIKGNKVFLDKKSRYSFASLAFVTGWISKNLDRTGIWEVGAKNSVKLEDIVAHFKLPATFEGRLDIQEVQNPLHEFPDAKEVYTFLEQKLQKNLFSKH